MHIAIYFRNSLAIITLLALGACGGVLDSNRQAAQTWWLEPLVESRTSDAETTSALQLKLTVAPGLDGNRIMALDPQARFSPLAGSFWADDLAKLVEYLLERSVASSGIFKEVSRNVSVSDGPACRLDLRVIAFHARLDNNSLPTGVEVGFEGKYRCGNDSRSIEALSRVPVGSNQMPGIVAAFQAALNDSTREVISQLQN